MSQQLPIQPPNARGQFTITDPEAQPGLTPEIERGQIPSGYINRYVVDHDVHCAFCPPHMPHRHGFTAQMADGRIALCGRDCGRKYFGHEVARGFEKALERAEERARRQQLIAEATAGIPAVQDLLWKTWVPAAIQIEAALRALPGFRFEHLQSDMENGTDFIFADVKVDWIEKPDGSRKPVETRTETSRVWQLSIIWEQPGKLSRSYRLCRQVMHGLDDQDKRVSEESRFRYRNALLRTLEDSIAWLAMAQIFFTPRNMVQFNKLNRLKKADGAKYQVKETAAGKVLRVRDADGVVETFKLPNLDKLPTEEELITPLRGGSTEGDVAP